MKFYLYRLKSFYKSQVKGQKSAIWLADPGHFWPLTDNNDYVWGFVLFSKENVTYQQV